MNWQPIETAPKNREILGYGLYQWENYDDLSSIGIAVIFYAKDSKKWKLKNANPYEDFMQPTHWMPLPTPPKAALAFGIKLTKGEK